MTDIINFLNTDVLSRITLYIVLVTHRSHTHSCLPKC